jgi:hypothetical protein
VEGTLLQAALLLEERFGIGAGLTCGKLSTVNVPYWLLNESEPG